MQSTECRFYADQCTQIARVVAPEERVLLLDLARKWCDAAEHLEMQERRSGDEKMHDGRRSEL